jgi:osomolarity two-component system, sensor histidine kinase NIK1
MDEYLSKPLKQNQLIQTIMKLATLGGALNDSLVNDLRATPNDEYPPSGTDGFLAPKSPARPGLEPRAFTDALNQASGGSPSILSVDVLDPMDKVSSAAFYAIRGISC